MELNTVVILKSFLGTQKSPKILHASNDFWKLTGQTGIIIDNNLQNKERVLVLFDQDLDQFLVANHKPIRNTLMIKMSDLECL